MNAHPLVVDLDGTLILTDTLHEAALRALRDQPLDILRIPLWLSRGKAVLKQGLAASTEFDASALPYHPELLAWLRQQHVQGRQLVLCTAADESIAQAIAAHLGLFDIVMASDGNHNLAGDNKARALEARFGRGGFDYAGNAQADLAVWQRARRAIVVNAPESLSKQAAAVSQVEHVFASPAPTLSVWLRMLRVHQWLKNLLLFVPLFAAHQLPGAQSGMALVLAFFAFSLCASAVYIGNDLLDLDSDRLHPRKCTRPFAAGRVPVAAGVLIAPVLLLGGLALATQVGAQFLGWLLFYFVLTCAYSLGIKRLILVDCLALAMLYTLRLVAGASAIALPLSYWLIAFGVFLFLSLAFVKRYAELIVQAAHGKHKAHGRGYYTADAPLVQTLGVAAGFSAVLVLALYLNSDAVVKLYRAPEFVWGTVPVMLYWVSWMWMQAHRGNMHDDPLVFALKDKASLLAGLAFAGVLALGTRGWTW